MKLASTFDQKALTFIANQIRKMKRIWIGGSIEKGMGRRRDAEAKIIEEATIIKPIDSLENINLSDKIIREKFNK